VIRVVGVEISAWVLDSAAGSRKYRRRGYLRAVNNSGRRTALTTAGVDMLAGDSRLPALRRVAQPLHRIAVNPCASSWLVRSNCHGRCHEFTCASIFSTSGRRASIVKFPATACDAYKLSPPLAALDYREPRHEESLAIIPQ
jgi:hypothetical protein